LITYLFYSVAAFQRSMTSTCELNLIYSNYFKYQIPLKALDFIFLCSDFHFQGCHLESLLSDQPWTSTAPTSMTCPCVFLHSLHALYFTLPHRAVVFIRFLCGP